MPPLAAIAGKEAINARFEMPLAQGVNFERRLFHGLFGVAGPERRHGGLHRKAAGGVDGEVNSLSSRAEYCHPGLDPGPSFFWDTPTRKAGSRVKPGMTERADIMAIIAFIGVGNMGGGMAANLAKAGHEVRAFDLSEDAVARAVSHGCTAATSARAAAHGADAIITMLPAGTHVAAAYHDALFAAASAHAVLIDCSTIDVATARSVGEAAAEKGLKMVDAPVSGGTAAADAGTLTFMVGGPEAAFALAQPYPGKNGQGGHPRRQRRDGPGRQDLQQHDSRRHHGRHRRSVRARRKTRPRCPDLLRHFVESQRPKLEHDQLLPRPRPSADHRRPTAITRVVSPAP